MHAIDHLLDGYAGENADRSGVLAGRCHIDSVRGTAGDALAGGRDPVPASIDRMNGIRSECEVIVTAEDVAVVGRDEADSRHERERVGVVV